MGIEFKCLGGSPNFNSKLAVGFVVHAFCEITRLGITNSLGGFFFAETLKRERANAGAFCFLVYCFVSSLVLAAFDIDTIGEAFVTGIVISFLPTVSVHMAMCYVCPPWRKLSILADIAGATVCFALTLSAQQSVAQ